MRNTREQKREEAEKRQSRYDALSILKKITKIEFRRCESTREINRLTRLQKKKGKSRSGTSKNTQVPEDTHTFIQNDNKGDEKLLPLDSKRGVKTG